MSVVLAVLATACRVDDGGDAQATAMTVATESSEEGPGTSELGSTGGEDASDPSTTTSSSSAGDDQSGTGTSEVDSTGTAGEPEPDVPEGTHCADVAAWDPSWVQLEEDVLALVNERREAGAICGGQPFAPAPPLSMHPALRCAARKHSKDMVVRNFFDHINPDGEAPADRIAMAGYGGTLVGENIQGGGATAADAMSWWMDSPPHCGNVMNPAYQWLGVGYQPGGQYGTTWTQTFGGP